MERHHARSKSRVSCDTVWALTGSSVTKAATRPTARVLSPRKNALQINRSTSAARR
jgi:hypothetical protein